MNKAPTLAIVSSKEEVDKILKLRGSHKFFFIAPTIAAEFYLRTKFDNWENPYYSLLKKSPDKQGKNYTFPNFKISHGFTQHSQLTHIKDRFGYFLTELDRSLDFATYALSVISPARVLLGAIYNYPGSSVVDGQLKTNAFMLVCKDKKIPYRLIGNKPKVKISLRQTLGSLIQTLRYFNKQSVGRSDLLLLANPSHVITMKQVVDDLMASGLKTTVLTYSLTPTLKRKLGDRDYLEKERLIDRDVNNGASKIHEDLIKSKPWDKFTHPKYKGRRMIIKYMREKLKYIVVSEMREVARDIVLADKIISNIKPRGLIVTTDPDTKVLPYIIAAKKKGVKTFCIQHGAFSGKDSPAVYPESNYFITWSKTVRNILLRVEHFRKVKILIGRSPFHKKGELLRSKFTKRSNIKVLFLATVTLTEKGYVNLWRKKLFDLLGSLNVEVLIRVHPYKSMDDYLALLEYSGVKISIVNKMTLDQSIGMSDLIIYENTTAGFDAMLSGRPTVYFNPYSGEDFYETGKHNASYTILNDEDMGGLSDFLKSIRSMGKANEHGRAYAIKYLGLDQKSNAIASAIKMAL